MAHGRGTELREDYVSGVRTEVTTARVRAEVAAVHADLAAAGLAIAAGDALSARIPGAELFVITPQATSFAAVGPETLVLCDLDGNVIPGTPGSELAPHASRLGHAHVYRALPEVGGLAQLHSTFATAWAVRGEEIPCAFAVAAERFGGAIPVVPYAATDDEALGRTIVDALAGGRSSALLIEQQGPVAAGPGPTEAAALAALVEDVARIAHVARDGGAVTPMTQAAIDRLYDSRPAPGPAAASARAPKPKKRQLNIDTKTKTSR